ncbi:ABC transporter substrate-binding protein [Lyngbya confervoides]|uniref:ABC transporter substrate-binding protein n=1 Tax=Lyngbya confervoides BDU141951 TaxID=1574623 RepID=A0ABD4T3C1_9CYAN|nr:ABC transporter substrate-binding protein [Lyngbya confervoides]MCM1982916.1 ABC transporter substrate-binding protein [Lyngbya confervoides BDU141951]
MFKSTLLKPIFAVSLLILGGFAAACDRCQPPPDPGANSSVQCIVALTSLSADLVHRLDASKLVGIPGSRLLENQPGFQSLPQVSQGRSQPNLETIVALQPDLVIGASGFHDAVLKRLAELGIQTWASEVNTWDALETLTEDLAIALEADAATVLDRFQRCRGSGGGATPRVLMLVSHQPILVPNEKSWAGEMLNRFQLQNAAATLQSDGPMAGFVTLSAENVLEVDPDLLLVVNAEPTTLQNLEQQPFWQKLSAVQRQQIHQADYYGLVNPGSVAAIEKACEQLAKLSAQDS